ncbi:MAG TPA: ABC transporter ATP-binding protein, partial [Limnochordales bacterium]
VHRRAARVQEGFGRLSQFVEESVAGIRVVKVFGQEQARMEQFRRLAAEQQERQMELVSVQSAAGPVTEGAVGLAFAALLGVGGPLVLAGRIHLGQFVAFAGYVGLLAWPLGSLGWLMNLWQRGSASWQRLQAILHTPPQVVDPPGVVAMPAPVRGHLEVRGLTFTYPGARRPALHDLSFQVRPGEVVAITGPSGSGKSTLVQLLLRLWEPPEGSIFLDGVDVRRLPLQELRRHLAWVPQEGFLFSGTLADNVAFGAPESPDGMPPAELERLGRLAGLHPDVEGFPDGYGSWVGERGLALSGGQRQRVAIARALARRAAVFLLDDPFSSVDGDTEHRVLEGLLQELAGRTVLLVSHRISVVRRACRILVLHQGRLVEEGSHEELLARGGLYARMAALQRLEEELNFRPGPTTQLQEVCGGARPVEPAG